MGLLSGTHKAPAVVLVRPTAGTDFYGDPYEDWDNPIRTALPGATVQFRDSEETADGGRVRIVTRRVLYVPGQWDLAASDRVEVGATEYRIDGEPAVHPGLDGYTSANLTKATG